MQFTTNELAQSFLSFIETKCPLIADKVKWDKIEEAIILTVTKNDICETKFHIDEEITANVECLFAPLNIVGVVLSFPANAEQTYRTMNKHMFKPDVFIFTRLLELFLNEVNFEYIQHLSSKPETVLSPETQVLNSLVNHLILYNVNHETIKHLGANVYRVDLEDSPQFICVTILTVKDSTIKKRHSTHLQISYTYDVLKPATLYEVSLIFGNWYCVQGNGKHVIQIPDDVKRLIDRFVTGNFKNNARLLNFEDYT